MASKSLGTLTLDLVARVGGFVAGMDKAERQSEKWRKSVEKNLKSAAKVSAAAAGAAVAAMGVWVARSIENAAELGRLAQIAGTGTREFQRFAAGTRTVGIEQDKLSDILKDVNDKVGDFLVTGGGPLKDFFEQVAPKVGVTADQFRNLSGPQALGLYVDTLEKAGANQQEMTFFMEAIANDATALIPLLRNGGKEMGRFGDEAERLGLVLSDDAIKAAQQFSTETDILKQQLSNIGSEIAGDVLPHLQQLTQVLSDPATVDAARAMAGGIGEALVYIVNNAVEAVNWIRRLGGEIDANNVALLEDEIERVQGMLAGNWGDRTILFGRDGLIEYYDEAELQAELKKLQDAVAEARGRSTAVAAMQVPGMQSGTGLGLNLANPKAATEAQKQQNNELKEYYRLAGEVASVVESSWSQQSQALAAYQREIEKLREGVLAGLISEDQAEEVGERLQAALDSQLEQIREAHAQAELDNAGFWERWLAGAEESLTNFNEMAASVVENFSGQFGDAFESVILDAESAGDAFNQMAEGMIRSVVNATGQMLAQWAAYEIAKLVLAKPAQAGAVVAMTANAQAASLTAGINAFSSTAAVPIVGPGLAPGAMAAALAATSPMVAAVSAAASAGLAGMAHDGIDKIPATGTWLLEKGERVTTAGTSAKLDATLDRIQAGMANGQSAPTINVIEDAGRAGQRDTREVDGRQIIDLFVANIRSDGAASKALQRAFGMRRVGG